MKETQTYEVIGKPKHRVDGAEKVSGKGIYTVDIELPGMAHAKILRSPYAHAKIVRVDARKAEKLPGVYGVITRDDQPRFGMFGATYKDQTLVAVEKCRYVGDPVAAVAAEGEGTGEGGLCFFEGGYEEMPPGTSIEERLAPGRALVSHASPAGGGMLGEA